MSGQKSLIKRARSVWGCALGKRARSPAVMAAATCSTPLKLLGVSGPSSMPPRSCRTR